MNYVITEHDELLPKAEAEKHGYEVVRKATKAEVMEHERELAYWRKQAADEQHTGSYHELPD